MGRHARISGSRHWRRSSKLEHLRPATSVYLRTKCGGVALEGAPSARRNRSVRPEPLSPFQTYGRPYFHLLLPLLYMFVLSLSPQAASPSRVRWRPVVRGSDLHPALSPCVCALTAPVSSGRGKGTAAGVHIRLPMHSHPLPTTSG
ncbi:hypothetical protein MRX96_012509 [Rhipicephalus microplus]